MIRTFRYPLRPTKTQEAVLDSWRVHCCDLYNGALQHRRDAWKRQRVYVRYSDQQGELTQLRAADAEWEAIPAWVARSALRRIDLAFRGFFRRVKAGEGPGFPRFRHRDGYDSFDLGHSAANLPRVVGNRVQLPKLGLVKFHKYREMRGVVRVVRIKREARGWYISFVCDVGDAPAKAPVASAVGIDLGLEAFATLSSGERVENPRFFRAGQELLTRRQQSLSRKKRGSSSRTRAKQLVARAHEHIRNQRLDFARKLACALYARFDLVAHEDLRIRQMMRALNGHLSKSIHDAGWGVAINCITSKAESAGKWAVATDPRRTSIDCSGCGHGVPKDMSQREHRCPNCGLVLHRDENAARNVLARGLRAAPLTEAEVST